MNIKCDRCGKNITNDWYGITGKVAGNCTKCGDNLCNDCVGFFNEEGECFDCQQIKNLEEINQMIDNTIEDNRK